MPGVQLEDESSKCTAGFAAQGNDGSYYLLTSGHCDAHDGSVWTYGPSIPLGAITVSEKEGDKRDAAIIRLNPAVGVPTGGVGGLTIRDVLSSNELKVDTPFCKLGAVTGETCGNITAINGDVLEAGVYSLGGDSGSPGYVKNDDGTVSAVGILMSSPEGTTTPPTSPLCTRCWASGESAFCPDGYRVSARSVLGTSRCGILSTDPRRPAGSLRIDRGNVKLAAPATQGSGR